MKRLLFFIFVLLGSLTVKGQTFTFECICDYVTDADSNCDICNTNIQSRLFKGILIRKNATAFKWIDQPYIVQFQGNNATFKELIPNGETITITLAGTPFDSIPQYQDSIKCPCAGSDNFFIAGPGIYFSGDTISAFDVSPINELQFVDSFYISAGNLYVSLDRDSVAASFVTLPVPTGAETIVTAGTGISVTGIGTSGSPYVVTNTLPHIGTNLTYSGTSSPLTLNSSTGSDVTHTAGTGISLTGTSSNMTITNTAPDQTVSITGAGINVATGTYPNFTITGTEVDGSVTNELQTYGHAGTTTYTNTLSGGGGSWSITGAGIAAISQTGGAITVTATEVDGSITNEGVLGVGAGGASSSTLLSTTSGANAVTFNYAGILSGTESVSANGGSITLTATEVDGSTSNELQTLANTSSATTHVATLSNSGGSLTLSEGSGITIATTGTTLDGIATITAVDASATNEAQTLTISGTTTGIITLNQISGVGGGAATIAGGTGITVAQSGGTITITNSSPATAGWLLDGNTITSAKRIGSIDNFDVIVKTNNTDRLFFDNAGTMSLGSTQLTTAAFNISGLQNNIGMHVAGGSSLTGPTMIQTRGNGSGSDCTVIDAQHSFLNGNVVATFQNTSTTGTGGVVITANAKTNTGDPRIHFAIDGITDWSLGIDNDDVDNLKLHRFAAPSDNNGVGTLEFGYDGTSLGLALNKVGIGTSVNNFYALDAFGKIRADQFVNNDPGTVTTGTIALGTAAGTSPTLDAAVSEFWGNGARIKFTSGTSPTANGVICTITLGTEYTFAECAPIMQGRSTNAGAFNYSCSFNSATRVITCTLVGTLTASTVYEFNLNVSGQN